MATYVIDSAERLSLFLCEAKHRRRDYQDISIRLPHVSPDDAARWEAKWRKHARACGCELGAVALVMTSVMGLIYVMAGYAGNQALAPKEWASWVGVVVFSAVCGKLLGIVRSAHQLENLQREIEQGVCGKLGQATNPGDKQGVPPHGELHPIDLRGQIGNSSY